MTARQLRNGLQRGLLLTAVLFVGVLQTEAQETPRGKGMTEANQEYLVLDDMEDVSDWYNGSPDETKLSASDKHVKEGKSALLFANVVDHTKGEKSYPVGWPRTGKYLSKVKMTDWSAYDSFECWIYVETNRDTLPNVPIGLGFRNTGNKQGSGFSLKEVVKDGWAKISIPMTKIADPKDIQSIQFHIAEANYKHGDRVDFYIDQMRLVRYAEPAISQLAVDRKVLYSGDRNLTTFYRLVGYKGIAEVTVEFEVGREAAAAAKATAQAQANSPQELALSLTGNLSPGPYWARLSLRDKAGNLLDRKQVEFRVIAGPF
jgi:hypothetical protein